MDAARRAGMLLHASCGGNGACGRCRVRIRSGAMQSPTAEERQQLTAADLADGYRLACQARIAGNVTAEIPFPSRAFLQTFPLPDLRIDLPPIEASVHDCAVGLPDTQLDDAPALWQALSAELRQRHDQDDVAPDAAAMISLPEQLRAGAGRARISLRGKEAISIRRTDSPPCGLAIDLGTTTMAGYLIDLESGQLLSARAMMNPQYRFGEDVMSRIACVLKHGDRELRRASVDGLNTLITALCAEPERIVDLTLVGNTAMHHIFLGLPVHQLGRAPYQPSVREPLDRKARDLGLAVAPGAYLHLPPPVGGFVGSDHLAMILAAGLHTTERTVLALDIGTNTEAALAHRGRLRALSCASGPALEGGHLTHGTWAAPGAIDRVSINADGVSYHVIGGMLPHGLCGSGIIDAIAGLVRAGMIDRKGTLTAAPQHQESLRRGEFMLAPAAETATGRPITISQQDVSEVQLAKAAIRAGVDILLDGAGLSWEGVDEIILTGGCGTALDPAAAVAIGMLPPVAPGRIRSLQAGAGAGALLCLISRSKRHTAAAIAGRISHVELMTHPGFAKKFGNAMYYPG